MLAIGMSDKHAGWLCGGGLPLSCSALAEALDGEAGFARRPQWRGAPAETGCWTRLGCEPGEPQPHNA
jgi:hypothetical protein